jgi:hypothetical protein
MSAVIVSLPDVWARLERAATEPSAPHIPFETSQAVRYFLLLENEWNSPKTSRSRRMDIITAMIEAAHPSDTEALILSASERKFVIAMRGMCPGWGEKRADR